MRGIFMIVRTSYLGFFPFGSDVCYHGVKIMQADWHEYPHIVVILGKKHVVNPFFGQVYYVTDGEAVVFFVAIEYGSGKYHIFTIHDIIQRKLKKKIG